MASKNHHRYKIRKRINTIKHETVSLFSEPAILIDSWEELSKLETDRHRIEVDLRYGCGNIVPKFELTNDDDYYINNAYLSTHTFYGSQYFESTAMLRRLGFNVQLANWDGDTIYCKQ